MLISPHRISGAYLSAVSQMYQLKPCLKRCFQRKRSSPPTTIRVQIENCWRVIPSDLSDNVQLRMLRCLYWREHGLSGFGDFCSKYFNGLNIWADVFQQNFVDWYRQEVPLKYPTAYRLTKAFLQAKPLISPAEGRYILYRLSPKTLDQLTSILESILQQASIAVIRRSYGLVIKFTATYTGQYSFV